MASLWLQLPHDTLLKNFTLQINTMALKTYYCKVVQFGQYYSDEMEMLTRDCPLEGYAHDLKSSTQCLK